MIPLLLYIVAAVLAALTSVGVGGRVSLGWLAVSLIALALA